MKPDASVVNALLAELSQYQSIQGAGPQGWRLGQKHTQPTGTPSLPYYTGPNGLWSVSGIERDIISTRVMPKGIAGAIPARGTNIMYPMYAFLTGFSESVSGSNPNGVCDDGPTAGPTQNCFTTATFGRYTYQTREFELNRLGQRINMDEPRDLRFVNDPGMYPGLNNNGIINPSIPGGAGMDPANELMMRFMEVGVAFQNKLTRQVYQGNPTNNTAGGGYGEFPGLDILIGANKKDAITGQSCPSLNSLILNYNYKLVTDVTPNGDIVNVITYMMRYLRKLAEDTNLAPVSWAIAMRETLFYELTALWPCSYMTRGCNFRTSDGTIVQNIDASSQIGLRDAMRNEQYLIIDGIRFPVVFDDAIDEQTSGEVGQALVPNTHFASDIYFIPMTIMGGQSVTYWEFFDFSGANAAMSAVNAGVMLQNFFWSDNGKYFWHMKPPKNWCVQWIAKVEPRLILRTPHLAAKLRNVRYQPLIHTRDAFPNDPYYVNSGVASRSTTPSLFAEWK